MRCRKAQEFLSLEMDGALPPDATVDLQEHLDSCPACREYRQEIHLGRRVLAATEPTLSENFDWKLQLRLNQALKETAGEVAYPWHEPGLDRWSWLRNFGTAAAMGLAAVLAVAVLTGPVEQPGEPVTSTVPTAGFASDQRVFGSDRLPLDGRFSVGSRLGRPVGASSSPFQGLEPSRVETRFLDRGWSGQNLEDLRTINRLRAQNQKLGKMLFHTQRQLQLMRAQLDSTEENALDLGRERP